MKTFILSLCFLFLSISGHAQEETVYRYPYDSIWYGVNLGNYQHSIPRNVFDYMSKELYVENIFIFKDQFNIYDIEIGYFKSYEQALPLLKKAIDDGYDTSFAYIRTYLCKTDITKNKTVPITNVSDSIYFSVFFGACNGFIPHDTIEYMSTQLGNEKIFIQKRAGSDVFIIYGGEYRCYDQALKLQEKVTQDGFTPVKRSLGFIAPITPRCCFAPYKESVAKKITEERCK